MSISRVSKFKKQQKNNDFHFITSKTSAVVGVVVVGIVCGGERQRE
jgi:hypothetical protein